MGIPGIYKQIGPGERVALSQIAVQHLERTGQPFRIAIDISIWQFQIQSGQGGKNPDLRTLYYRLLRLLALSIHPLFVFDGPDKPPFKRGRKIAPGAVSLPNSRTKELLQLFGFPHHTAPGEAEAECALLQKANIVDAVLSEDVDTMMFGCSMTMRTWTAEGARGGKTPTHVNVYKAQNLKEEKGIDSDGMILVALMSGGDYIPAGIAGCGPKIAFEAAKAGFGRDLCQLSKDDTNGMITWRERLEREIQTNESKFFRQKHKTMKIPNTFPDQTALGYYTHPAVSSAEEVARLRREIKWHLEANVQGLRLFVAETFEWRYLSGAKKFIRGLAPALLTHRLIKRSENYASDHDDIEVKEGSEKNLVKSICGRRNHWNTGGEPELRSAYIPIHIVGLDLDLEEKEDLQAYCQDASEDEQPTSECDETRDRSKSPTKRRGPSTYDPTHVEKIWILETHVKLGVPLLVETWEEDMRDPKKFASRKAREKAQTTISKAGGDTGALDQYVKITKRTHDTVTKSAAKAKQNSHMPPAYLAPALVDTMTSQQRKALVENTKVVGEKAQQPRLPAMTKAKSTGKAQSASQTSTLPKNHETNPWTLAKRTPQNPKFRSPPRDASRETANSKIKALGQKLSSDSTMSPGGRKRHSRPSTPISDAEETTRPINENVTLRKTKPSTPARRHDPSKPSPRKKRSPLQMANELYMAGQLLTPTMTPSGKEHDALTTVAVVDDPLTVLKVNRKLDFTLSNSTEKSSKSPPPLSPSSSPLPSPSTLLSPPAKPTATIPTHREEPPPSPSKPPQQLADVRKLVALRESLEGAWKHLEAWEVEAAESSTRRGQGRRRGKVFSSVEVVDLTGG